MALANDFKTIISVDNKRFVKGLGEAEKSYKAFTDKIGKAGEAGKGFQSFLSGSVGMVGKLAGGLGVAVGAFEVFDKAINSNANLQGDYIKAMETGKTVTDQFFSAIYSGDWKVFDNGIKGAIENAKAYAGEMRDLQLMFEVMRSRYDDIEAAKTRLESTIEDESLPLSERKEAFGKIESLLNNSIDQASEKLRIAADKLSSSIEGRIGSANYVNADNAGDILKDLRDPTSSLTEELREYAKAKEEATTKVNWNVFKMTGEEAYEATQKAARSFYSTYTKEERERNDELLRLQGELSGKVYSQWSQIIDEISAYSERIGVWKKDLSGARDEINGASESEGGSLIDPDKTKQAAEGSIAYLDQELSKWREEFNNATTQEARVAADKMIRELSDKKAKIKMEVEIEYTHSDEEVEKIKKESSQPLQVGSIVTNRDLVTDVEKGVISSPVPAVGGGSDSDTDEYVDAIESVSGAMAQLSGVVDGVAASWLNYASTMLSSIAKVLPKLSELATQNAAVAVTGTAASNASMGPVGWIIALSAIGSIVAAMASAPKFANGGIVPGNMFTGDRVPAMLNSGEMILNRTQQGNLFRILNEGGTYRREPVKVFGEFVLTGRQLKAVLKEQDRWDRAAGNPRDIIFKGTRF